MDEHPIVVRYWNGPRSALAPRTQGIKHAKPVYFITGFGSFYDAMGERVGPPMFVYDELLDNPQERMCVCSMLL